MPEELNIVTKERAKIVQIEKTTEENWGTNNIRVVPEREELRDKDGGRWINKSNIIEVL